MSASSKDEICKEWDLAMRLLTGGNSEESLGIQRYKEYKKRVLLNGSSVLRAHVWPPPPTSRATMQHSLLAYHQIMTWLGISLPPEEDGCFIQNNKYRSRITMDRAAPDQ